MLSRVLDPSTIVRVQSWEATASAPPAVDQAIGVAWPRETGAVASALVDVLCVGPTQWLVIDRDPNAGDLRERLGAAFAGSPLEPTDVSRGFARIELEGPETHPFLLKGCSLDLTGDRCTKQWCSPTRFAGVPIVLRCHDPSRFEGIVPASYQEYLLAWIADASA